MICEKLENNHTLISFNYHENNFGFEDSRQIQEYLIRNKAEYDYEKLMEWGERKKMRDEDAALRKVNLEQNSLKIQQ